MASNPSTVTTPSINEILQEMKHMNDDDIKLSFPEAVHALKARAELRLHFVYLPIPMAFFILFAWTALVHVPIQHMFPAEVGLETTLVSMGTDAITPNTTMKFKNIQTQADVFAWLLDTFVPSVFVTTDYNGNNFTDASLLRRIDGFNKILGAVEFKTTRASPMRCDADKHLATLFPTCHDFLHPVDMEPVYIDATVDAATASLILQAKQMSGTWINTSTTSLIVNVATFNGELNVLCITSLKVLFKNGGAIDTQFTMSAVPSDPYHGHWSGGPIALDAFVGLLFVLTLAKEFYLIYRSIRDKTLISVVWDAWRIIEWASLGFVALFYILWAFLCVNIYDKDIVTHLKALDGGTNHDITTLETLMTKLTYMGRVMVSVRLSAMTALFLLVARIMGAVRFHPHLNLVTATLTASLHSLGSFSLIFFTCLAAFVTSGVVLFGERLVQFSTIGRATVTVINMLFGQFDLSAILEVDYHIGVVWYWCAMIILFLMLFNMLLAIVLAAFDDVRSRSRADRNVFEEFFIIAKEVLHVTTVSEKFKDGVSDGTLHRLDPRAVAEFLRIKESHAREFLREMKILSRAGADLSGEAINVDQGGIDNQLAVEDRLSKIENLLAKSQHDVQHRESFGKMRAKDVVTPVPSLETLKENDDFTLSYQEALNAVKARQNLRAHFMYLPFPIILFVLFAWAALIHVPIWEMYPAESGLGSALITTGTDAITPNTTTKLKNIRTQADVFAWLTDTLLPAVFVTSDSNEALTSNRIAYYHKVLGAVEFKTWIAKEKDCGLEGSYGMIYNICHDFENFVLDAVFYIDSGATIEEAKEFIVTRQDEGTWLNQSTAVLQINVATYNGELDLMGVTSLILTFQSGGYIETEYKMAMIPADPYHSNHTGLVLDIIIGVFVIATIIFQSKLAYDRFRAKMPYWDFWRLIEWVSMGAVIVFYILWIILCSVIYNENLSSELLTLEVSGKYDFSNKSDLEEAGPLLTEIMDRMRSMGSLMVALRLVGLASLFLLIVRVLGSLRFHPRLNIVTATLGAALNSLQPFFFVFVICLAAFVTSGCLLFGEKLEQFSTIGYAIVTVVNMLFGQFDLEAVFEVDYLIALVWYWCTMIVLFLVLFNMLLAIVLAAFDQVRDINSDAPSRSVRKEFSIIAKEMIGVDRFLHGKANKRFRQSVQNGSLQNLTHVSSRSLCEHLEIDDKEAMYLVDKLKVLSRAGADLNQNKLERKKTNDESDEDDIKSLQEKIERLEQTIAKLVAHLDKSS